MGSHISLVEVIGLGLATAIVHQQRSKLQILRQSAKFNDANDKGRSSTSQS